jgi:hypothetical protein
MADLASELRRAMEVLIQARINNTVKERGWDEAAAMRMFGDAAGGTTSAANVTALTFATGYDPGTGLTVAPFTFDLSFLDAPAADGSVGPDELL